MLTHHEHICAFCGERYPCTGSGLAHWLFADDGLCPVCEAAFDPPPEADADDTPVVFRLKGDL